MPSLLHEGLRELFRNCPTLAPYLLNEALGIEVPAYRHASVTDTTLSEIIPAEYRVDVAELLLENEGPVLAVAVEVQLTQDPGKKYSWPLYAPALRARHRCPACVLVIAPDPAVAAWASKPIETGPGNSFVPLVVGPEKVPLVTQREEARRAPELAVLSAVAHGKGKRAEEVAVTALFAAAGLDKEQAALYHELVVSALGEPARKALEKLMDIGKYEFTTDFAKKHIAIGRAEGRAEGEAKGALRVLRRLLDKLGANLNEPTSNRLAAAPADTLEQIAEDIIGLSERETILEVVERHLDGNAGAP